MDTQDVLRTPVGQWPQPMASAFTKHTPSVHLQEGDEHLPSTPFRNLMHQTPSGSGLRSGARRIVVAVPKEDPTKDTKEKERVHVAPPAHRERGNYMKPTEAFRLGLEDPSATPARVAKKQTIATRTPVRTPKKTPETIVRAHHPVSTHGALASTPADVPHALTRHVQGEVWGTPVRAHVERPSSTPPSSRRPITSPRADTGPTPSSKPRRPQTPTYAQQARIGSPPRERSEHTGTILFSPLAHGSRGDKDKTSAITRRAVSAPKERLPPRSLASAMQAYGPSIPGGTPAATASPRPDKIGVRIQSPSIRDHMHPTSPPASGAVSVGPSVQHPHSQNLKLKQPTPASVTANKLSQNKAAKQAAMAKAKAMASQPRRKLYEAPTFSNLMRQKTVSASQATAVGHTKVGKPRHPAGRSRDQPTAVGFSSQEAEDVMRAISQSDRSHVYMNTQGSVFTASTTSLPDPTKGYVFHPAKEAMHEASFESEISSVHGGEDGQGSVSFQASLDLSAMNDLLCTEGHTKAPAPPAPSTQTIPITTHDRATPFELQMEFSDISMVEANSSSPKSLSFTSSFVTFQDSVASGRRAAFSPIPDMSFRSRAGSVSSIYSATNISLRRSLSTTSNAETLLSTLNSSHLRRENDWCREYIDMLPSAEASAPDGTLGSNMSSILNQAMMQSSESEIVMAGNVLTDSMLTNALPLTSASASLSLYTDSNPNNMTLSTSDANYIAQAFGPPSTSMVSGHSDKENCCPTDSLDMPPPPPTCDPSSSSSNAISEAFSDFDQVSDAPEMATNPWIEMQISSIVPAQDSSQPTADSSASHYNVSDDQSSHDDRLEHFQTILSDTPERPDQLSAVEPSSEGSILSSVSLLMPTKSGEVEPVPRTSPSLRNVVATKHIAKHHNFEELEQRSVPEPATEWSALGEEDPLVAMRARLLQRTSVSFHAFEQEMKLQLPYTSSRSPADISGDAELDLHGSQYDA